VGVGLFGSWQLVEIQISERLGDRLFLGLAQRLLEPARQRGVTSLFSFHRLRKERFAPRILSRENFRRGIQLRLVGALNFAVRDHAAQVGINHKRGAAAGTGNLELARQLRHNVPIIR
jgi:hypothetical protein